MNSGGPSVVSGGSRRFSSVLAARPNNVPPSDLEVHLREHCQRLRVSEKLSGAHFVFPGESSLAVRAYYPRDIAAIEILLSSTGDKADDVDGIAQFAKQFRFSVVLFVVPPGNGHSAFKSIHSFTHRTQQILESNCDEIMARVIFVSSTQQAIAAITGVADAIRPSTSKLKHGYFQRQEEHQLKAAQGPRAAFLEWSTQNGLQNADALLLTRFLPNLLAAASSDFQDVPCDPRTKLLLRSMFHDENDDDETAQDTMTSAAEAFMQPIPSQHQEQPSLYAAENTFPPVCLGAPAMETAPTAFAPTLTRAPMVHTSFPPYSRGSMGYAYPSVSFPSTVPQTTGRQMPLRLISHSGLLPQFDPLQYQHQFM